jgi:hypothetical protein
MRIHGNREVQVGAHQVHAALQEHQVVAADTIRIGRQVRDLDDSAHAGKHPFGDHHTGDHR